jgi:hypothetical protein
MKVFWIPDIRIRTLLSKLLPLDRKNIGGEFSFEYQITSTIKGSFSAGYGQFTYDSNPNVSINNDALATVENTAFIRFWNGALKNYKQAGMPQQAYGLGIEYRDPKYWWIGTNINYLPITILISARTDGFILILPADFLSRSYRRTSEGIIEPRKIDPVVLLNLIGGKS